MSQLALPMVSPPGCVLLSAKERAHIARRRAAVTADSCSSNRADNLFGLVKAEAFELSEARGHILTDRSALCHYPLQAVHEYWLTLVVYSSLQWTRTCCRSLHNRQHES